MGEKLLRTKLLPTVVPFSYRGLQAEWYMQSFFSPLFVYFFAVNSSMCVCVYVHAVIFCVWTKRNQEQQKKTTQTSNNAQTFRSFTGRHSCNILHIQQSRNTLTIALKNPRHEYVLRCDDVFYAIISRLFRFVIILSLSLWHTLSSSYHSQYALSAFVDMNSVYFRCMCDFSLPAHARHSPLCDYAPKIRQNKPLDRRWDKHLLLSFTEISMQTDLQDQIKLENEKRSFCKCRCHCVFTLFSECFWMAVPNIGIHNFMQKICKLYCLCVLYVLLNAHALDASTIPHSNELSLRYNWFHFILSSLVIAITWNCLWLWVCHTLNAWRSASHPPEPYRPDSIWIAQAFFANRCKRFRNEMYTIFGG